MSLTISASLNAEIAWTQVDRASSNTISINDSTSVKLADTLAYGTGADQTNIVAYSSGSVVSGGTGFLDLFSVPRSVLGATQNINFSGGYIKFAIFKNLNTISGQDLRLSLTGAGAFNGPFAGSGIHHDLRANSCLMFGEPTLGWPVNTGQRYIYFTDSTATGTGTVWEVGFVGKI